MIFIEYGMIFTIFFFGAPAKGDRTQENLYKWEEKAHKVGRIMKIVAYPRIDP